MLDQVQAKAGPFALTTDTRIGQPVSYTLDLPITGPSGTVDLPMDKNLPGDRTLTFSLTRGDNFAVTGPQGSVILQDVTITGLR